ncbi:tetratricopeptide repeat protein [Flavobacterium columnare]|uniref:Tetratricopeptide repeat protein n=1 Tax=Flavobacterium columnare TaxID=996 RepID=A0A437UAR3_9FLAO|nr:tetratricopeptide repeat protein [Flavobacterium columnare]RVU90693.1 tetratricopeptide repeat protein [Flavobacterium columnare]
MKRIILHIVLLISVSIFAQQKKDFELPNGVSKFEKKQYIEAEANFRISKSNNPKKAVSAYNLGNAIYKQNQVSEAKTVYIKATEIAKTKNEKQYAYHNLGNTYMKEKTYDKAVEAYKNALRNNPADEESRYNYALAKKLLKENPPSKNDDEKKDKKGDSPDKKPNQDSNQDKDKKQNDKNKNKQDKPNNKDQNKDQNQNNPQPKPNNVPKDRMQNLLDAVNNEEKKIQDRVNARKVKGAPRQEGKDW